MGYLKHNKDGQPKKQSQKKQPKRAVPEDGPVKAVLMGPQGHDAPSMQHDINYVAGLGGVEQSLDWIARGISRLTSDEHRVGLSHSTDYGYDPVKITLAENDYDDTMGRLLTALERIADAVAKLAGLSRPRLEHWHEQAEYEPLYRSSAADGGAPGPKVKPDVSNA